MSRSLACCGTLLLMFHSVIHAHELPDGVVERDVQIIVFPERVEVQFSVEMSEKTMRAEFRSLNAETALDSKPRKAWDQYRLALGDELPKQMELKIDGAPRLLKMVRSETIEKHSIQLSWFMVAEIAAGPKFQSISVRDKNFEEMSGYHRLALKGRRGVEVEDSTVPSIVSQLPRTPWEQLSEKQKNRASSAEARFRLP